MCVAQLVDFRHTGRGSSSRQGCWKERRTFHTPLFDATNRRNGQTTTVNIISVPTKQFQLSNEKKIKNILAQNLKKGKGGLPLSFLGVSFFLNQNRSYKIAPFNPGTISGMKRALHC